jgi:hypothetical protein
MTDKSSSQRGPSPDRAQRIRELVEKLGAAGVRGLDQYECRLRSNARKAENLRDLLDEGRAALALRRGGFGVLLRESPDIEVTLDGETVFVEVKHFREKEQDRIDERAMCEATDLLVRTGDTVPLEGLHAWAQIVNVAIRKAPQYVAGHPNVLVIMSSSDSLELMAATAAHSFDDVVAERNDPRLRRLNAIMLVNTGWVGIHDSMFENVEFEPTAHPAAPLSDRMLAAWKSIHLA